MAFPPRQHSCTSRLLLCLVALAGFVGQLSFVPSAPGVRSIHAIADSPRVGRRTVGLDDAATVEGLQVNAKARLLDLLDDEFLSQDVLRAEGKSMRGRLDEAILELERTNPTEEPAYSEMLDGTWNVKYVGTYAPGILDSPTRELALFLYSGGFSPGNALTSFAQGFWGQSFGLKVSNKVVRIRSGRDVEASSDVEVFGQQTKLSYKAEIFPLSSTRISEEIVSAELPVPVGKQDAVVELRRNIFITFLDEELMIVRDESGVPDVLLRELARIEPAEKSVDDSNATDVDQPLVDAANASTPALSTDPTTGAV